MLHPKNTLYPYLVHLDSFNVRLSSQLILGARLLYQTSILKKFLNKYSSKVTTDRHI